MATVVYPQVLRQPNPLNGLGEGMGALGDILGQVLSRYHDNNLLSQGMPAAQEKAASGDLSGYLDLLTSARTPDAKQQIMAALNLTPQPLYQQDSDTGQVTQVGTMPSNAKLVPQDPLKRQMRHDENMAKLQGQKDEAASDRLAQREAAHDARTEKALAMRDARQQTHDAAMLNMRIKHDEWIANREETKDKRQLKQQGLQALGQYSRYKSQLKTNAQKAMKDLSSLSFLNPKEYAAQAKDIQDQLQAGIAELDETWGPAVEAGGFKLPKSQRVGGETGSKQNFSISASGQKEGQKAKGSDGNIYVVKNGQWVKE